MKQKQGKDLSNFGIGINRNLRILLLSTLFTMLMVTFVGNSTNIIILNGGSNNESSKAVENLKSK